MADWYPVFISLLTGAEACLIGGEVPDTEPVLCITRDSQSFYEALSTLLALCLLLFILFYWCLLGQILVARFLIRVRASPWGV